MEVNYSRTLFIYFRRKFFNEVLALYLKAAQRSSGTETEADADVQNGLGVLLTLNSDYDKAIDCFDFAVQIRPNVSTPFTITNETKPNY